MKLNYHYRNTDRLALRHPFVSRIIIIRNIPAATELMWPTVVLNFKLSLTTYRRTNIASASTLETLPLGRAAGLASVVLLRMS